MSSTIVLTPFARTRLFPQSARRNALCGVTPEQFETYLNQHQPLQVRPGYAPFCRLLVFRNWTSSRCATIAITADNQHLLRSAYEARTEAELPVLTRWFEGLEAPRAAYLQVIVYDRAQLAREGSPIDADWGVVGCLATLDDQETPLTPITLLRNALGVEEGGSGVALDRDAYRASVAFWQRHATWRG